MPFISFPASPRYFQVNSFIDFSLPSPQRVVTVLRELASFAQGARDESTPVLQVIDDL